MSAPQLDPEKIEEFVGQVITDFGASVSNALALIGHRLGLYRAMADAGPVTPARLAERTGTHERYVREWLNNQAAGGYVIYDATNDTYELPPEHAFVLANEDSPMFMAGAFPSAAAIWGVQSRIETAFQTGEGVGWHEQDALLFSATEMFFGPQYRANLVSNWIPALEGVEERLRSGARVADIGCGQGLSTVLMAEAFPNSAFLGFDYHDESIELARKRAAKRDVENRVAFDVATARQFPGDDYDLICYFDCLHDLGDPVGAARHTRAALADDGVVMLVEPRAEDRVEDNLTPFGRVGYGMSTLICTPNSLSQDVGLALGAQAGESAVQEVFEEAGFTGFGRAAETPVHLVLEARP